MGRLRHDVYEKHESGDFWVSGESGTDGKTRKMNIGGSNSGIGNVSELGKPGTSVTAPGTWHWIDIESISEGAFGNSNTYHYNHSYRNDNLRLAIINLRFTLNGDRGGTALIFAVDNADNPIIKPYIEVPFIACRGTQNTNAVHMILRVLPGFGKIAAQCTPANEDPISTTPMKAGETYTVNFSYIY